VRRNDVQFIRPYVQVSGEQPPSTQPQPPGDRPLTAPARASGRGPLIHFGGKRDAAIATARSPIMEMSS
jgi:hypothetical protein